MSPALVVQAQRDWCVFHLVAGSSGANSSAGSKRGWGRVSDVRHQIQLPINSRNISLQVPICPKRRLEKGNLFPFLLSGLSL